FVCKRVMKSSEKDNILKKITGNELEIDEFYINSGDKGIKKNKKRRRGLKKGQRNVQNRKTSNNNTV
ncbi:hypothetical protein, partial [Methanotorris formicicus]